MEIKVSKEDKDILDNFKWFVYNARKDAKNPRFYARRYERNPQKNIYMHRQIMARIIGRPLKNCEYVDHIDFDGLNNRRENLQICTPAENVRKQRISHRNKSGFKGVSQRKSGNWVAQISFKGKRVNIGFYKEKLHAHIAYDAVAGVLFNKFHINDLADFRAK